MPDETKKPQAPKAEPKEEKSNTSDLERSLKIAKELVESLGATALSNDVALRETTAAAGKAEQIVSHLLVAIDNAK